MHQPLPHCICDNYIPYRSTIKGICAPMMPMEDCVNCRKERFTLGTLQHSQLPFTVESLNTLMYGGLTYELVLDHLEQLKTKVRGGSTLFLHIHRQTGRNINDEGYSLEQAARDILEKNTKLHQSCEKYLLNYLQTSIDNNL